LLRSPKALKYRCCLRGKSKLHVNPNSLILTGNRDDGGDDRRLPEQVRKEAARAIESDGKWVHKRNLEATGVWASNRSKERRHQRLGKSNTPIS